MDICIDFDGTCVTHEFPRIGKDIGAVPVLKKLVENGHNLILFTMRGDVDRPYSDDPHIVSTSGNYLEDAVNWFEKHDIKLHGININPRQSFWTNSPKAYAQLYIDDAALGCPIMIDHNLSNRPFVNWVLVEQYLLNSGFIK